MPVLYAFIAAACVFLAFIVIKALLFRPAKENNEPAEEMLFDKEKTVSALAELVRCKTISYWDKEKEDEAEFAKLVDMLPNLYPNVHRSCTLTRLPGRALLYCWKGREEGDCAVFMSHYDVVPAEEENWEKPPFSGIIEDGVLWGRGTIDTKVTLNGIMSAAESLIQQAFTPRHDIYFAFSGGEEVSGPGARNIVEYFIDKGITPSLVLDEGGGVVENVFPGVKKPCAMVGIAEKGMMNLEFKLSTNGGHASAPAPHTPVGILAAACAKIENRPFKAHFTKPALDMFNTLGRHSSLPFRIIFANVPCFKWLIDLIAKKSGGEFNALVRTTVAFTQMNGSEAPNVIPPTASMVANIRLNPADSTKGAIEYIRSVIDNESIMLEGTNLTEPSPISRTDCEGWERISKAVSDTWKGCVVSPYLMVQCSDSRHYRDLSDKVYKFSAMDLTAEERKTVHGNNERIRLDVIARSVEFFMRVMKQC